MRLYRRRENGKPIGPWCAVWYDSDGIRQRRSTKQMDKRAAEAVAREWERDGADPTRVASRTTLGQALDMLIDTRAGQAQAGKRSAETVGFYREKAANWRKVLGDPFPLVKLTAPVIDRYLGARRDLGASENTLHKELTTLRGALKLAKRAGLWRGSLEEIMPVGFSAEYKPRERVLTWNELVALLAALDPNDASRCAFIVATSARLGESDRARREDVAPDGAFVRLRGTKTELSARVVPIVGRARILLAFALEHAHKEGLLFSEWRSPQAGLKVACDRAKIPHCSFNDLRRTCATWLREGGASPALIAPILGHVDSRLVETTYGRLSPEALGALLEQAMGLAPARPNVSENDPQKLCQKRVKNCDSEGSKQEILDAPEVFSGSMIPESFQGVPGTIVEPLHLSVPDPKSGESANSAILAFEERRAYNMNLQPGKHRKRQSHNPDRS
jgi:integrase